MAERGAIFCLQHLVFADVQQQLSRILPQDSIIEYSNTSAGVSLYTSRHTEIVHNAFLHLFTHSEQHWLVVSLEEGATWSYVLYRGSAVADRFCTSREYWGEVDQSEWNGNPALVARVFNTPEERITRYLVDWTYLASGEFSVSGYAYPDDPYDCGYAMVYQCVAFFERLGFVWPRVEWSRL
jgi:hypothetical protein